MRRRGFLAAMAGAVAGLFGLRKAVAAESGTPIFGDNIMWPGRPKYTSYFEPWNEWSWDIRSYDGGVSLAQKCGEEYVLAEMPLCPKCRGFWVGDMLRCEECKGTGRPANSQPTFYRIRDGSCEQIGYDEYLAALSGTHRASFE